MRAKHFEAVFTPIHRFYHHFHHHFIIIIASVGQILFVDWDSGCNYRVVHIFPILYYEGCTLKIIDFSLLYYNQKYFSDDHFSYNNNYSPYPNLEGIKDALFYKFGRPTIGQI